MKRIIIYFVVSSLLIVEVISEEDYFCTRPSKVPKALKYQKSINECLSMNEKTKECLKFGVPKNKVNKENCKKNSETWREWEKRLDKVWRSKNARDDDKLNECLLKFWSDWYKREDKEVDSGANSHQLPKFFQKQSS